MTNETRQGQITKPGSPSLRRSPRARLLTAAVLAWALSPAAVIAAAGHEPPADLAGIISTKDLKSGVVPLTAADLQFYLKNLQASVARYQHPTAKDLADIAEAKRLQAVEIADQQKMAQDMKAGNTQEAMTEDMFHPTPEQSAAMDRGNAFKYGRTAEMLARDAGMGGDQWGRLSEVVERAAGLDAGTGYGSADDSPTPKPTAAQLAQQRVRVDAWRRTDAANQKLVAPDAAEIKALKNRLSQLIVAQEQ